MKKRNILICALLAIATTLAAAEEKCFVLATAGVMDDIFAAQISEQLIAYTGLAILTAAPTSTVPGQTLEDIGRAAVATLPPEAHSLIVLARPIDDQPQGMCLPDEKFAVLNIAKLEVGADSAILQRRTLQECYRVMTMLLDLDFCPFPLCVLTGYEKLEDLDDMSGNFCPPCLDRFTRAAQAAELQFMPTTEE